MPVETAADRLTFLSLDEFAVEAIYSPTEGPVGTINGIFDRQHLAIDAQEVTVTTAVTTFTCRAEDLARVSLGKSPQDDRLRIDGQQWRVVEPQPDGTGMVVLVLRKD